MYIAVIIFDLGVIIMNWDIIGYIAHIFIF